MGSESGSAMALTACKTCKKEISDEAVSCPQCGAPQKAFLDQKAGWGLKISIVAIGLIALGIVGNIVEQGGPSADTPGGKVVADLRSKQAECRSNLDKAIALGAERVSDSDGSSVAEFYRPVWDGLDHDDKIKQGLLVFCARMPASGRYSVMIRDRQSGEKLGSVTDGNWFD